MSSLVWHEVRWTLKMSPNISHFSLFQLNHTETEPTKPQELIAFNYARFKIEFWGVRWNWISLNWMRQPQNIIVEIIGLELARSYPVLLYAIGKIDAGNLPWSAFASGNDIRCCQWIIYIELLISRINLRNIIRNARGCTKPQCKVGLLLRGSFSTLSRVKSF